jgi:hypothetical protein
VLDTKTAYGTPWPQSSKGLPSALAQVSDGSIVEMQIVTKWLEGKRWRYNLIRFRDGVVQRSLAGWNGDLVEE